MSWLREERDKARLSQAALAKKMGVSQPVVSLLEGGNRRATRDEVEALAAALGYDEDAVLMNSNFTPVWLINGLTENDQKLMFELRKKLKGR